MSLKPNYIIQQAKYKLNKLDSKDFDNIPDTVILTAYNEGRIKWLRRNLSGTNNSKSGDESTKIRLDDFNQILGSPVHLNLAEKDGYYISQKLTSLTNEYFQFKRLDNLKGRNNCCKNEMSMVAYLVGESDIPMYLQTSDKCPSFEWGQVLCTLADNRLKIYTDNKFKLNTENVNLIYYRFPKPVMKAGVVDLETEQVSSVDVPCEFKKDLGLLFIEEAVSILASNLELYNQAQVNSQEVEKNN